MAAYLLMSPTGSNGRFQAHGHTMAQGKLSRSQDKTKAMNVRKRLARMKGKLRREEGRLEGA